MSTSGTQWLILFYKKNNLFLTIVPSKNFTSNLNKLSPIELFNYA